MDLFAFKHTYAYLFKGNPGEISNKEQGKQKGRIGVVCCVCCPFYVYMYVYVSGVNVCVCVCVCVHACTRAHVHAYVCSQKTTMGATPQF